MNKLFKEKSVTLVELAIGVAIFGIVVLAVSQLDLFSNSSVIYAQRRIDLTNEASIALEHISRQMSLAIGTRLNPAASNVPISGDVALRFWVDSNGNFRRDAGDVQRAYRLRGAGAAPQRRHRLYYCASCTVANNCVTCVGPNDPGPGGAWGVLVAQNVDYFGAINPPGGAVTLQDNFATIEIQTCSNPGAANCNTPNNPEVTMRATIKMPSYSTN